MSNEVGNVRAVIWAWGYACLFGVVATVLLMVLVDWDFSPAAFVGLLIIVLVGGIVTWAGRPLPRFDDDREARARAAGAEALAAGATGLTSGLSHAHAPAAAPAAATAAITAAPAVAQAKPEMLAAARGGQPDDLKIIKGIGPKLEEMLHRMGVFHFDQIATWKAAELAWVDDNLEGFKGRASRDHWVDQARILAAGGSVDDYQIGGR